MTLVPAYGRDYRSIKAVKADFDANKDFQIVSVFDGAGKYCNKNDLKEHGITEVNIRYSKLRKVTVVKI